MIYSLDIYIVCNNQAILDAIENKVPAKLDSQIWPDDYSVNQGVDEENNKFIQIMVRFRDIANRQVVLNWMKTKAQNIQAEILPGSYVGYHLCDHNKDGQPGCGETIKLWSK